MKRKSIVCMLVVLLVAMLVIPAHAEAQLSYVTDAAGLLSDTEWADLESRCAAAAQRYGCGVYIITVDDFRDYGSGDVFEVTYGLYHEYELGVGGGRDGVILLLSMDDRDYALFVYGDQAQYAFNDYGQIRLEEEFLPHLGVNNWYDGFRAYADTCASMLEQAQSGDPVRQSKAPAIGIAILASFLVSLVVCLILRSGMKNVAAKTEAGVYVSGQLNLSRKIDQYTHTTTTRTKIQSSSGSSGVRTGGGGSGRSGKF